jgi:2-phospho-L-lactate guanylyltransferase (CobY/MobA/RfbA family)
MNWSFSQTQRRREGLPASLYVPSDVPALKTMSVTPKCEEAANVRDVIVETAGGGAEMPVMTGRKLREGENLSR